MTGGEQSEMPLADWRGRSVCVSAGVGLVPDSSPAIRRGRGSVQGPLLICVAAVYARRGSEYGSGNQRLVCGRDGQGNSGGSY